MHTSLVDIFSTEPLYLVLSKSLSYKISVLVVVIRLQCTQQCCQECNCSRGPTVSPLPGSDIVWRRRRGPFRPILCLLYLCIVPRESPGSILPSTKRELSSQCFPCRRWRHDFQLHTSFFSVAILRNASICMSSWLGVHLAPRCSQIFYLIQGFPDNMTPFPWGLAKVSY